MPCKVHMQQQVFVSSSHQDSILQCYQEVVFTWISRVCIYSQPFKIPNPLKANALRYESRYTHPKPPPPTPTPTSYPRADKCHDRDTPPNRIVLSQTSLSCNPNPEPEQCMLVANVIYRVTPAPRLHTAENPNIGSRGVSPCSRANCLCLAHLSIPCRCYHGVHWM